MAGNFSHLLSCTQPNTGHPVLHSKVPGVAFVVTFFSSVSTFSVISVLASTIPSPAPLPASLLSFGRGVESGNTRTTKPTNYSKSEK